MLHLVFGLVHVLMHDLELSTRSPTCGDGHSALQALPSIDGPVCRCLRALKPDTCTWRCSIMLDALHGLTKTGEGYGRPGGESTLPIDINYAKLVEWLVCTSARSH